MKKQNNIEDLMKSDYDFSGGVRGKHSKKMSEGYSVTVYNSDKEIIELSHNVNENLQIDDMRPEYDFSDAVPNNYAERLFLQKHFIKIDDDLFNLFNTSEKVNNALRAIMNAIPENSKNQIVSV